MRETIKIKINIPPTTKKNSQQIIYNKNRPFIIQSKRYRIYEKSCGIFLNRYKKSIDYPVEVKCLFYMPSHRRVDLTNLLEAIDDILVKYQVLKDDNFKIIVSHDGSRVLYDKENPRTEIEIRSIDDI